MPTQLSETVRSPPKPPARKPAKKPAKKPAEPPKLPALVGVAEAAELLGVSRGTISLRRRPSVKWWPGDDLPPFPKPVTVLRCGPIWLRSAFLEYRRELKRCSGMDFIERLDLDTSLGRDHR